jgi:hypothetical protein
MASTISGATAERRRPPTLKVTRKQPGKKDNAKSLNVTSHFEEYDVA